MVVWMTWRRYLWQICQPPPASLLSAGLRPPQMTRCTLCWESFTKQPNQFPGFLWGDLILNIITNLLGRLVLLTLFPPLSQLPLPGSVSLDLLLNAEYRQPVRLSHLSPEAGDSGWQWLAGSLSLSLLVTTVSLLSTSISPGRMLQPSRSLYSCGNTTASN